LSSLLLIARSFTLIQLTSDENKQLQLIPEAPEQLDLWYETLYASLAALASVPRSPSSLPRGSSLSSTHLK
jgi:hypothetical protein